MSLSIDKASQYLFGHVKAAKSKKSRCPICDKKCLEYEKTTISRKWRHLDFGSCGVFIVADVHRVQCPEHGVHNEMVLCAYHNSNFSKKFKKTGCHLALPLIYV